MALKNRETEGAELPKPPTETPGSKPENNGTRPPRVNEDVEKRLNPYIEANKDAMERYTKLVKENPDRAVRTLMLKDMQAHEGEMRMVEKQMPAAKEWYDKQTLEVKKAIDKRIAEVHPYNRDQAFVQAVVRERNWQNRLPLAQTPRPAMAGARP
jgi:hypothetical protein